MNLGPSTSLSSTLSPYYVPDPETDSPCPDAAEHYTRQARDLAEGLSHWRDTITEDDPSPRDTLSARALGSYDGARGEPPHDVDRFGDDAQGRALHRAYVDGYREGSELAGTGKRAGIDAVRRAFRALPPDGTLKRVVWELLDSEPGLRMWSADVVAARVETLTGKKCSKQTAKKGMRGYGEAMGLTRDEILFPDADGEVHTRPGPDSDPALNSALGAMRANPQLARWSDREVASRLGISCSKVVGQARAQLVAAGIWPQVTTREYRWRGRVCKRDFEAEKPREVNGYGSHNGQPPWEGE